MAKRTAKKKKATTADLPDELQPLTSMHIVSLQAEKVLRLDGVFLTFDKDNALVIEGKNRQGKTGVVDSFALLLSGGKPPRKLLHGDADEGSIVATFETDVGELIVAKTFTQGKAPVLKITLEGRRAAFKSPQDILNILLNHISLRIMKFAEMSEAAQVEMIATIQGYDPTELDNKHAKLYDERTEVNREVKRLEGAYKSITHHADAPDKKVSASEMLTKLDEITAHNATGDELSKALDTTTADLAAARDELTQAKKTLLEAQESVDELVASQACAISADDDFEPKDDSELRDQIKKADATNEAVIDNANKAEAHTKYLAAQKQSDELTDQMAEIDRERNEAMLKAQENLPVKGLGLTSEYVTFDGEPFSQAGASATALVSAAVAIAANKDSPFKILLIDDGEKMDAETTRQVVEMAKAAGFQTLITRVLRGKKVTAGCVLIEDGQVKA